MDKTFQLPQTTMIGGNETALTLREIIRRLEVEIIVRWLSFGSKKRYTLQLGFYLL